MKINQLKISFFASNFKTFPPLSLLQFHQWKLNNFHTKKKKWWEKKVMKSSSQFWPWSLMFFLPRRLWNLFTILMNFFYWDFSSFPWIFTMMKKKWNGNWKFIENIFVAFKVFLLIFSLSEYDDVIYRWYSWCCWWWKTRQSIYRTIIERKLHSWKKKKIN